VIYRLNLEAEFTAADLVAAAGTNKREDFFFGLLGTPRSSQQS
jgi:hypothetical protein